MQPSNVHKKAQREALSRENLFLLDTKVLPSARSWLDMPGLRDHGLNTLRHWGEDVPGDALKTSRVEA